MKELIPGQLILIEHFINANTAQQHFEELQSETAWFSDTITMFGKEFIQPRLINFQGDPGLSYVYSKKEYTTAIWHPSVLSIKEAIEIQFRNKIQFNCVLMNYYRNGSDSMGWHADNEPELGENPSIASLSLGGVRVMNIKNKKSKRLTKISLNPGSLLLMKGAFQENFIHAIPKTTKPVPPRINLTFRQIKKGL
ncbi:alpha-ketoglutarate-dependent dioxygenase AlkB family protein [Luteibaculum oceani]|uniref:Alpha-ketoglutarate-dependent dioxygenase AlkB n=1 Tax=Luteibaculum oceani TaxID=1294296 RepID=A0A5C6VKR2_9FLAO|nr:alpha-ketoglutarate-dependent dioxygenase AlkB [Luteibaculum oceani]TXC85304.1 alpha-ketoglutarate-dependent dioxygenase AlkB [Luteibaculum oceani]